MSRHLLDPGGPTAGVVVPLDTAQTCFSGAEGSLIDYGYMSINMAALVITYQTEVKLRKYQNNGLPISVILF